MIYALCVGNFNLNGKTYFDFGSASFTMMKVKTKFGKIWISKFYNDDS